MDLVMQSVFIGAQCQPRLHRVHDNPQLCLEGVYLHRSTLPHTL